MFSDHAAFLRQGEMGQVDLFFVMMGLGCSSGKRTSRPSERLGRDANRLAIFSDTTSPLARREGVHVRCARNPHGVHGVSLLQTHEEALRRESFFFPISFHTSILFFGANSNSDPEWWVLGVVGVQGVQGTESA